MTTLATTADERRRAARPALKLRLRLRRWLRWLVIVDVGAAAIAMLAGVLARLDKIPSSLAGVPVAWLVVIVTLAWPLALLASGAYDVRFLASGSEEFRRIGNAGMWMLGTLIFAAFLGRAEPPRGTIVIGIPLLVLLTAVERYAARRMLQRRIIGGQPIYSAFLVGSRRDVTELAQHIARIPWAGFSVVGSRLQGEDADDATDPASAVASLLTEVRAAGADTIAVAGSGALAPGMLRALSWRLEGTGIDLVLAPSVTDIAGPRIVVRPVEGLPLLHVEDPELRAGQRALKGAIDRSVAVLALLVLGPVLLGVAIAALATSGRPVLFRQERVGIHGRRFVLWKFRTMVDGAHESVGDLTHLNEHDGLLFKVRDDPRVTRFGRRLRRLSLDELPQLWNVVRGDMSLVGPRPPLQSEVDRYGDDVWRRLLVKPGMTGLWQIGGRAELPWAEAVRLDLYYVENWSIALDLMVLWKTIWAVLEGHGAY